MAAKSEEVSTAPTGGAGLLGDAHLEKKPEPGLTGDSNTTKEGLPTKETDVDDAAAGVADLSFSDSKDETKRLEESLALSAVVAPPVQTTEAAPADTVAPTQGPFWPETSPDHPLTKFYDGFGALVTEAAHNEVYGIELSKSNAFHTKLILQKFLRANQNDLDKAKQQLLDTLKWRKEFDPSKAVDESFEKSRFDGLGYVLEVDGVPESPNKIDIVTFNIYGAVKDNKATFGDLEA